jgi:predicted PurR-regulated permease PerM
MSGWRIALWVGVVLVAVIFLWLVRSVLFPFILSLVIAALLEPVIRRLTERKIPRGVAIIGVLTLFFGIGAVVTIAVAPIVVRQISGVSVQAQDLTRTLLEDGEKENYFMRWRPATLFARADTPSAQLDTFLARNGEVLEQLGLPSTRRGLVDQYIAGNRTRIAGFVRGTFDSFFGFVTGLFSQAFLIVLIPVIVTMMLFEIDKIRQSTPTWIPPSIRQGTLAVMRDVSQVFLGYLRGISLLVLYFSIVQTIMLSVANVPFALLIGIVFGSFYLIPIIGNYIAAAGIFLICGFSGITGNAFFDVANPWIYGAVIALIYVLIGASFDTFVVPQVVGDSVGISPIMSIFVVMAGQALFGLPGMVLAFPLAGSIKVILDRVLRFATAPAVGGGMPVTPLRHRRSVSS